MTEDAHQYITAIRALLVDMERFQSRSAGVLIA